MKPDLTDTDLFVNGDPHAAWAWLRNEPPITVPSFELYVVWSTYAAARSS